MSVARCARLLPAPRMLAPGRYNLSPPVSATLLPSRGITRTHGDLGGGLSPAVAAMRPPVPRNIHTVSENRTSAVENLEPKRSFVERMLRKAGILDVQKYRTMVLGYRVYEHVMGQVDYQFFFKHFNMPDTFFSWFLVTELHVWMIMVRYMANENEGKIIRNNAVAAMWDDTKARVEQLGKIKAKLKNEQIQEISYQFNAAMIGYDEGISSDDKTLAAALWRRFFQLEGNNPEHLETLVVYVRKQICLFDNLPDHEIIRRPVLKLIDIKTLCKQQE